MHHWIVPNHQIISARRSFYFHVGVSFSCSSDLLSLRYVNSISSMWCSTRSIKRHSIVVISVVPNVHVDSDLESLTSRPKGCNFLAWIQLMAKRESVVRWQPTSTRRLSADTSTLVDGCKIVSAFDDWSDDEDSTSA
jgi:hypothetical protein